MDTGRLEHLYLENANRLYEFKIENLGQFNLIVGDNGTGKTYLMKDLVNRRKGYQFEPFEHIPSNEIAKFYINKIHKINEIQSMFLKNMQVFIPGISFIGAIILYNKARIYINEGGRNLELDNYGDGTKKIFKIMLSIALHENTFLAIENIDSHIHYSKLQEFWRIVIQFADKFNVQLFATTYNEESIVAFAEVVKCEEMEHFKDKMRLVKLLKNASITKAYIRTYNEIEFDFH